MQHKRIDRWDNVKAVLIFLVVIGHFMYYLAEKANQRQWIQSVYLVIYLFHMPLFVFISGMMERRTIATGEKLGKKVTGFLILGIALRMLNFVIRYHFHDQTEYHLTHEQSVVWYVIALAAWIPLTRALRRTDRRLVLVMAVALSLVVGFDPEVGGGFSLSRIITFYPFFLAGTMTDPDRLDEKLSGLSDRWKTLSLLTLLIALGISLVMIRRLWPFLDILKGWKPYTSLKIHPEFGPVYRFAWYGAAAVLSAAAVILIPREKCALTATGKRTLQIYLFHRPIMHFIWFLGGREFVKDDAAGEMLYLLLGVIVFFVLNHPVFTIPLNRFWELVWREESNE